MARTTVYNNITTEEKLSQINPDNIDLMNDFLDYLSSLDRSKGTINGYRSDLEIFFVWNLDANKNKYFVDLTKREVAKFQNHALNTWGWSSNRIRRVKSALSSLSNYIENILDDEIKNFKPIIKKIESPVKEPVREKTILSDEQVESLLNTLVEKGKYQCACAIALAAYSGARKSELCRFKTSYFNEENIILDGAMYKTPEKIKTKGKGGKIAKQLYKYTLIDFKKYYDLWMKQREELGIESEWLFVTKREDKYVQAEKTLMDSFARSSSQILGLSFYFHSLRHFLCSKMSANNLPNSVIVAYFGWNKEGGDAMVGIYNDNDVTDSFDEFFSADGIKQAERKGLSDM